MCYCFIIGLLKFTNTQHINKMLSIYTNISDIILLSTLNVFNLAKSLSICILTPATL